VCDDHCATPPGRNCLLWTGFFLFEDVVALKSGATFSHKKMINSAKNMDKAKLWALFSQSHLVTLAVF
jgi:hypothetical protein